MPHDGEIAHTKHAEVNAHAKLRGICRSFFTPGYQIINGLGCNDLLMRNNSMIRVGASEKTRNLWPGQTRRPWKVQGFSHRASPYEVFFHWGDLQRTHRLFHQLQMPAIDGQHLSYLNGHQWLAAADLWVWLNVDSAVSQRLTTLGLPPSQR